MAIYSQASDLKTRQTVWVGRKTESAPQISYGDMPTAVESAWLAGAYAEKWAGDHVAPTF